MKVQESFVIAETPERLWAFLEQVDEVARCVPGIDSVEQVDADNSNVRLTQAVGPMTATFEMKLRITERRPHESMTFTAIGRAVRGAAGNVRSTNTVRLAPVDAGTRIDVEADVALGGMLGSVGQKVVAKQAGKVTNSFAEALQQRLTGAPAPAVPAAAAPPRPAAAPVPAAAPAGAPAPAPARGRPGPRGLDHRQGRRARPRRDRRRRAHRGARRLAAAPPEALSPWPPDRRAASSAPRPPGSRPTRRPRISCAPASGSSNSSPPRRRSCAWRR
jgi:carbon monoxide dehydrogenase subunit G